jgi:hypothetical protein
MSYEVLLSQFYRACNPSKTLDTSETEAQKYYIDFSEARGSNTIEELHANIALFSPDEPTCQLFAGHIGCGKSTELLRLKSTLEAEGFYVVYFESSQDLDMADVDIGDILLAIARQVSENLDKLHFHTPMPGLENLLDGTEQLLNAQFDGLTEPPNRNLSLTEPLSISDRLRQITTYAKHSPELRSKLRQHLEPRVTPILRAINTELLVPTIEALQQLDRKGLVVIVDNLDRVEGVHKPWGRSQPEYLFVDRGEQLAQLQCHVVYTIPLGLMFSPDLGRLTLRFNVDPKVLPMVPIKERDGSLCESGLNQLRQMVLARAFPELEPAERLRRLPEVFDDRYTLDRLCYISGGHVRNLLRLLHRCLEKQRQLPLSREIIEAAIRERCNQLILSIGDEEWELLRQVALEKRVRGGDNYQALIRSMFVFEYRDDDGSWFDLNPILAEAQGFKDDGTQSSCGE